MLKKKETYICDTIPDDEDIEKGMEIAKENDVIVEIRWHVSYWWYNVLIRSDSEFDDIKNKIPRIYGI